MACLIISTEINHYADVGGQYHSSLSDQDALRISAEMEAIANRLDVRGRRRPGVVLSVDIAVWIAGVGDRLNAAWEMMVLDD